MSKRANKLVRLLEQRWVPWLLLILLVCNAVVQPGGTWHRRTFVGALVYDLQGRARPSTSLPIYYFAVEFKSDGTWHNLKSEWADPSTTSHVVIKWNTKKHQTGVWSPVLDTRHDLVEVLDYRSNPPNSLGVTERFAALSAIERSQPGTFGQDRLSYYASGGSTTTRILWLGVLNDLFVLLLFIALGCSLVLNVKRIRRERRERDLLRNLCPSCGYSLENLRGPICPECGKPLSIKTT